MRGLFCLQIVTAHKDGITLGEFKKLFGDPAVLNVNLKDNSSGNTYNVSLTITLP